MAIAYGCKEGFGNCKGHVESSIFLTCPITIRLMIRIFGHLLSDYHVKHDPPSMKLGFILGLN